MAFIRLPLGIKVAIEYDWNGKAVVNIYHVTTSDPITTIKLTTIAAVFRDAVVSQLLGFISEQIAMTSVTTLNLNEANGERIILPVIPAAAGLYTGDSVSNNVASVASLKTALTGRSFQGRSYIPGIPEGEVSQNQLGPVIVAGIAGFFTALQADLTIENTDLVVASFQTLGVPRGVGVATPIDSVFINFRVDTQRRRLPAQ